MIEDQRKLLEDFSGQMVSLRARTHPCKLDARQTADSILPPEDGGWQDDPA